MLIYCVVFKYNFKILQRVRITREKKKTTSICVPML